MQFSPGAPQTRNDLQFEAQSPVHFKVQTSDPFTVVRQSPPTGRDVPSSSEKSEKPPAVAEKTVENAWLRSKVEPTATTATTQPKELATRANPEQASTGGKTEPPILSTKTPVQAIEKAIDTLLQGTSSDSAKFSPERSVAQEIRPVERPHALETRQSSATDLDRTITFSASPKQTTDHASQAISPGSQPLHQELPRVDAVISTAPEQALNARVEPKLLQPIEQRFETRVEQPLEPRAEQRTEQKFEQRSDQLRIIQQIVAADYEPPITLGKILSSDPLSFARELAPSIHPRHESTTVNVQMLRESLLSKLEMIQSQIQTNVTERHHVEHTRSPSGLPGLQGRGDLLKIDPILHDAKPSVDVRLADRSSAPPSIIKILTDAPRTMSAIVAPGASILHHGELGLEHRRGDMHRTDSLERLLNALKKFSKRSTNFELMKRMDSALEQTCLSLVTAVALGVVGIEVMIRLAHAALAALLKELQERKKNSSDEPDAENQLESELASYLTNARVDDDTIGSVVDVSGLIVSHDDSEPIAGILLGSRELGSAVSAQDGTFLFRNIPFGVSYTLSLYKGLHHVTPNTVSGVSGVASFHRIEVTLTATRPRSA
jgi:hypothetical protein